MSPRAYSPLDRTISLHLCYCPRAREVTSKDEVIASVAGTVATFVRRPHAGEQPRPGQSSALFWEYKMSMYEVLAVASLEFSSICSFTATASHQTHRQPQFTMARLSQLFALTVLAAASLTSGSPSAKRQVGQTFTGDGE